MWEHQVRCRGIPWHACPVYSSRIASGERPNILPTKFDPRGRLGLEEPEAFDRAAELVRGHARVALGRVEVLVAEELLDLAEVRPGAEQLRCEDVTKGVGRDALALGDTCGPRVAEKRLGQDRLRQPPPLHADEERQLGVAGAYLEVLDEERLERGMNRNRPLPATLHLPHRQHAAVQVEVLAVDAEKLAPAEARVGEEREQQTGALTPTATA